MRIITVLLVLLCLSSQGQDIPLFSQKLTNSFLYNPSFAGNGVGSFTFSHRNNYSGVTGAPKNNFLSLHAPLANYRFGVGINVFQEEVTGLKTSYGSASFAYHINFDRYSSLSFGVNGEYNSLRLTDAGIAQNDGTDVVLSRYAKGVNTPDFSFGMSYQNKMVQIGLAANRLKTAWIDADSAKNLANYYSGFIHGTIPLEGARSVIEPYFTFRKFNESTQSFNVGLYYTYNDKIIAGLAARSGNVFSATLGYKITKTITVGYSREMLLGNIGGYTGSSNEFVMRLDFSDRDDKKKDFKADYKSSLSYHKKSLSKSASTRTSGRSPKQLQKAKRRVAAYSPSSRYQNISKLSKGAKSPSRNKSFNKGKKKTSYKKKPGNKKRKKPVRRRR